MCAGGGAWAWRRRRRRRRAQGGGGTCDGHPRGGMAVWVPRARGAGHGHWRPPAGRGGPASEIAPTVTGGRRRRRPGERALPERRCGPAGDALGGKRRRAMPNVSGLFGCETWRSAGRRRAGTCPTGRGRRPRAASGRTGRQPRCSAADSAGVMWPWKELVGQSWSEIPAG